MTLSDCLRFGSGLRSVPTCVQLVEACNNANLPSLFSSILDATYLRPVVNKHRNLSNQHTILPMCSRRRILYPPRIPAKLHRYSSNVAIAKLILKNLKAIRCIPQERFDPALLCDSLVSAESAVLDPQKLSPNWLVPVTLYYRLETGSHLLPCPIKSHGRSRFEFITPRLSARYRRPRCTSDDGVLWLATVCIGCSPNGCSQTRDLFGDGIRCHSRNLAPQCG